MSHSCGHVFASRLLSFIELAKEVSPPVSTHATLWQSHKGTTFICCQIGQANHIWMEHLANLWSAPVLVKFPLMIGYAIASKHTVVELALYRTKQATSACKPIVSSPVHGFD